MDFFGGEWGQFGAKFAETCIDFDVVHLAIYLVWRFIYRSFLPTRGISWCITVFNTQPVDIVLLLI